MEAPVRGGAQVGLLAAGQTNESALGGPAPVTLTQGPFGSCALRALRAITWMLRNGNGRNGPVSGTVPWMAWMCRCGPLELPALPARPRKSPAFTLEPVASSFLFKEPGCM